MSANDPRNLIAEKITLDDLQRRFGLDDRPDPAAFLEWQQDLPTSPTTIDRVLTKLKLTTPIYQNARFSRPW